MINGETLHSEDYLMAVGNTLSTAIDSNESYLGDTLSKIGAKTAVAGAMYLSDKETADTYFNEMVGQEVGNFLAGYASNQMSSFGNATDSKAHLAGLGAATGAISAGISSYASTFVSNRMGGMSARDSFAEAYDGLGSSMIEAAKSSAAKTSRPTAARADLFGMAMDAATNTQRMDFGTIKNLQIVDELNDGEDKAYGAFDSATGKVMVGRELINQAQAGDKDAAAHLLGLLKEELSHREAQAEEQALGIKDFQYDEGALAARQMLKALGEHDGRTVFTFNANDESFDFETSADAINKAVDDKFGWGRILSDRQSGSLEFNSSNTANDALSNENLAAMLAQNPDFEMKSAEEQQGMIDQLRQSTNAYYDGVMDQAVEDGSLASYMLAAGAQGLANVGLGLAGLFDASTDDFSSTARGTIKSVANFGPEAFNGAVNLTKTVLDGYSYGLDLVGIDASGFRETEAFNLGLNMEYANEAEQGGALLGGLLGGAAASKFGQHRIIIDDIGTTNRQAGAINVRIEGPEISRLKSEGHALERHGGDVTDEQLYVRARTGVAPDGSKTRRNYTPTSTAFNSDELLVNADNFLRKNHLDDAIKNAPDGADRVKVTANMETVVGRGYVPVGKKSGLSGPMKKVDNLTNVEAWYKYNATKKAWQTDTIYPTERR